MDDRGGLRRTPVGERKLTDPWAALADHDRIEVTAFGLGNWFLTGNLFHFRANRANNLGGDFDVLFEQAAGQAEPDAAGGLGALLLALQAGDQRLAGGGAHVGPGSGDGGGADIPIQRWQREQRGVQAVDTSREQSL